MIRKKFIPTKSTFTGLVLLLPLVACDSKLQFSAEIIQKAEGNLELPVELPPTPEPAVIPTPVPPTPTPIPVVITTPEPTPVPPTPEPVVIPTPTPIPPTPTPTPVPPTPTPIVYEKTSGSCATNSGTQLLSCINCVVPPVPPQEPQLSVKGSNLLEIMSLGCNIRNGSDPAGYKPPTRSTLLSRLNRLNQSLYPQSSQPSTIGSLLSSSSLRSYVFSGLYYHPPYSDDFETYFGITVAEARYTLCYNDPNAVFKPSRNVTTTIQSKQYLDCMYSTGSSCSEIPSYVAGNVYRKQLGNAMVESSVNPWKPSGPAIQKTCTYETMSGTNSGEVITQVNSWISSGFTVGAEIVSQSICSTISSSNQIINSQGEIKVAAYKCK